ncbi:MAG: hypothetical protein Q9214_005721, partial [Letrouitia sp. 1 TL-2023]
MPHSPRASGRRSEQMMGQAPLAANARAHALPSPDDDPVMAVTRDVSRLDSSGVVM